MSVISETIPVDILTFERELLYRRRTTDPKIKHEIVDREDLSALENGIYDDITQAKAAGQTDSSLTDMKLVGLDSI